MVFGNEVLLGAIPMEDMDLVDAALECARSDLIRSNPNMPASLAMPRQAGIR